MPSDDVHIKWAYRFAFVASIMLYVGGLDLLHVIFLAGVFMFGTKFVSPDLDIDSIPYQRWGFAKVFFWPYLHFVPHRSKWSHNLILGPIVLVTYFCLVLVVIGVCLNVFWLPVIEPIIDWAQEMLTQVLSLNMSRENIVLIIPFIASLLAAAAYHIIVDNVFKGDRKA